MTRAPYHHGALRAALLDAAEIILERDGVPAVTVRAVARAAGVSHAAPTHHFGDLTGLLSELAAVGYGRFGEHLANAADNAGADQRTRLEALGTAYVRFARRFPNLFLLMFRGERLDWSRPALRGAADAAFETLRAAQPDGGQPDGDPLVGAIRSWSLVHGFALLEIDGFMPPDRAPDTLLAAVLGYGRT